ncbi:hypothetical protein CcrC1_gp469 [Caulobacter phage C1]|nr:hypothetical protein CcrC1_gp469 [Caulobacter phage C1]UTU08679.1 hypothetical protein CcrC2_gp451 [Caulobacter phage C2]WGN97345.1 hypothetical protein [Bertelyvirus sp.]
MPACPLPERCPTCGRPVKTIFEHLAERCEDWIDEDPGDDADEDA